MTDVIDDRSTLDGRRSTVDGSPVHAALRHAFMKCAIGALEAA